MSGAAPTGEPATAAAAPESRRPATLGAALARAAADGAGGLRFVDRREEADFASWRELHDTALRTGGALAALGVERGERVALIFPTGRDFFAALFGILAAGAVPVPLYPPVRLGRLAEYHRRTARMVELVGARLLLADRRIKRILGETVERARPALGCRTLAELPAAAPLAAVAAVDPGELALVQFSSGTTVEPKPVALSHRAVLAQVEILNAGWPHDAGVRPTGASWLPLYHDMGLIGCAFAALELPTDLTLIPPEAFVARPAIWLRTLSRYRATVSPAPNFAYGLCVAKIRDDELAGVDLSSWRVALNGAEAVAPSVLRAFRDRFARWGFPAEALTPVYGLSEAALAVTFSDLGRPFVTGRFDRDALARERVARREPRRAGDRLGGAAPPRLRAEGPAPRRTSRRAPVTPAAAAAPSPSPVAPRGAGGAAVGARAVADGGLPRPAAGDRPHPPRRLARHRRSGLPRRRRAVPDRPRQGRGHPPRPQLRPRGDRARPPRRRRRAAGVRGGVELARRGGRRRDADGVRRTLPRDDGGGGGGAAGGLLGGGPRRDRPGPRSGRRRRPRHPAAHLVGEAPPPGDPAPATWPASWRRRRR